MTLTASFSSPVATLRVVVLGAALLAMQGCGMIYKTTGDVLMGFGRSEMLPHMMSDDDTRIACAAGEAQTPLLLAFERVGSNPDKLAVLMYVTASSCTDELALEQELRYLRSIKQGNVAEAQDARILQKRYAAMSAKRQYEAYRRLMIAFKHPKDGECPKMKAEFDQLVWMIGMVGGVQALLNDGIADGTVGVPRDIAAKVERGAACLNNDQWWGTPRGIRASIWNILPMLAPANAQPWEELQAASESGFRDGVRLGSAMYALAAYSKGDDKHLRKAIRDFAANDKKIHPEYRMMDAMANSIISGISDRMWTEATGRRTPLGGLGTFWDDAATNQPAINIDDLL
ncbi:MAG: hypothetical protein CVV10_02815 [Gammaproteobacteria bacterium HGW-Gammaproteobacteria-14]|nr:MAG: hypothetical protein CVV10_02815 [Gammaproteobacteria bacterium HGW-Gammaproteobacteria-14]